MAKHRETSRHLEAFEKWYAASRDFGKIWKDLETPEQTLRNWGTWFDWHGRADRRDTEAKALADREAVKRKAQMLIRHRQSGEVMHLRGMEWYKNNKIESAADACRSIEKGIQIERQAEQMPDWVIEILNADEQQLRRTEAELDARRRAALADGPDSPGDAAVAVGSNGNGKH